ncbi:hypothetical protein [Longimicrobium sp.]|uniref:hypothetical protein n=1 Tax=Longimicrobium sp. TaxID=2029185 RepID=UPI002E355F6A|nr:hypothetical protein [Longimicrobium sp.]HEX6037643.1 hypothetical protein [Longimicrobium sp.]
MVRRFPLPARMLALAAVLALAACDDAGTAPTSYVQVVSGGAWVAVAEPQGMARADTWLPWLAEDGAAAAQARQLREAAGRARGAGRIEESLALEDDALRLVAGSLARAPDPLRVLVPLAALDSWTDRARERLATGRYPELEAAAMGVSAEAAAARGAMVAGDTTVAVLHIARGTILAREHSALGVGVRLLASIEERLGKPGAGESANVRRARRLLAGAREGLATGDTVRALRRAVYALQLLEEEGFGVPAPGND